MSGLAFAFIILVVGFVGILALCFWAILKMGDQIADLNTALATAIREQKYTEQEAQRSWDEYSRIASQQYSIPTTTDPRPTLIDQIIATETEELEAARGAMYRIRDIMSTHLSAKSNGGGPLFSQNKSAVADRAIEAMVIKLCDHDDLATVHAWMVQHPGQLEKLN